MKRKKAIPIDRSVLHSAIRRFTKQPDRGTALVAAAWVDDALDECLRATFRDEPDRADALLRNDRPLGTFSARIKLAYLLGLVEESARRDLEIIRDIRNDFAHVREELRFTTPTINDRCRALHAVQAIGLGRGYSLKSAREMFVLTAYFLTEYVLAGARVAREKRDAERKRLEDMGWTDPKMFDSYGSWIRRTMKTATLQGTLHWIEGQIARRAEAFSEEGAEDQSVEWALQTVRRHVKSRIENGSPDASGTGKEQARKKSRAKSEKS